jgi:hypothetical protein
MRIFGKLRLSVLPSLAVTLVAIGAGPSSASAQEATGPYGMKFLVTPYLWLAGINATTKTPLQQVPEVESSVGPFQLLGDLNGAPFMGAFEVRQGPLGFLGDVLHVPVSTNITTHNVFIQDGNAALKANMGTGLVLDRLLDQPTQYADAGLGFRAWGFSADLSLNPGLLAGQSVNRGSGWGDPLIGGRYHYDFGDGFGLTAYGDVGGFGVGAHVDWQLIGTIDYTLALGSTFIRVIAASILTIRRATAIWASTFT